MMTQDIERRLLHLRNNMVDSAVVRSGLKDILLKYYPAGAKIIITKDYYKVEEPESEEI